MKQFFKYILILFLGYLVFYVSFSFAWNINATNKWAWGTDIGWVNFKPVNGDITITNTGVTGQAWSNNYGWIYMQPTNSWVQNTVEWLNGSGTCLWNLSGSAWNSNLGWIDFDGISVDATWYLSGNATGSWSGDISMSGSLFVVQTDWTPDCTSPIASTCTTSPAIANDGTSVTTTCIGVEIWATLTIPNMSCSPSPATGTWTVECIWTVGSWGWQISTSDDIVTVTDSTGNTNTTETTGLMIDTTAPLVPVITSPTNGSSISDTTPIFTGTGVTWDTIIATWPSWETCTSIVDASWDWECTISPALSMGSNIINITATDPAGNTSIATVTTLSLVTDTTDTDSDGVTDVVESQIGTDPTDNDSDNDGTPDSNNDLDNISPAIELAAANNGDGNGDGTLDAIQNDVASIVNTVDNHSNTLGIAWSGGDTCNQITAFSSLTESSLTDDIYYNYNLGLWDLEFKCTSSWATADVKIYLDTAYDTTGWIYRKYNQSTSTYTDISSIVTYTTEVVGTTPVTVVNYQITDGGIYDEDGLANGTIVDPSWPAVTITSGGGWWGGRTRDTCPGWDYSWSRYDNTCSNDDTTGDSDTSTSDEWASQDSWDYDNDGIADLMDKEELEESEEGIEKTIEIEGEEVLYTLQNTFDSCSVVANIKDSEYIYSSKGVFVDEDLSQYKQELLKFKAIGIVDGYEDGSFQPLKEISRTEFLKVVLISHCYYYRDMDTTTLSYGDVDKLSWQAKVIAKWKELGLINGDIDKQGNPIFRPDDIITKAEAVKIMMRMSMIHSDNPAILGYTDVSVQWHKPYVRIGQTLGLFDPRKEWESFYPDGGVTREDMIHLIKRLVELY